MVLLTDLTTINNGNISLHERVLLDTWVMFCLASRVQTSPVLMCYLSCPRNVLLQQMLSNRTNLQTAVFLDASSVSVALHETPICAPWPSVYTAEDEFSARQDSCYAYTGPVWEAQSTTTKSVGAYSKDGPALPCPGQRMDARGQPLFFSFNPAQVCPGYIWESRLSDFSMIHSNAQ